jgi:rod shape-determining protein MreC
MYVVVRTPSNVLVTHGKFGSTHVRPGDRVVTSGDGGVLPAGLPVGQVVMGTDGRLRVSLSADYQRLEFLRVLRSHELEPITDPGALVAPPPAPPPAPDLTTETTEATDGTASTEATRPLTGNEPND